MKITDTLEHLLRLLVTSDEEGVARQGGSTPRSEQQSDSAARPLPDWVRRINERPQPEVRSAPETSVPASQPPPPVVTHGDEPAPAEGTQPVTPALESLISWVQTQQPSATAVAVEEEPPVELLQAANVVAEPEPVVAAVPDYEPEPIVVEPAPVVVEPVVLEPVGVELVDAQPALVEPLGIEPVVEPTPRPEVESVFGEAPAPEHIREPEPVFVEASAPEHVREPGPMFVEASAPEHVSEPEPMLVEPSEPEHVPDPGPLLVEDSVLQPTPADALSSQSDDPVMPESVAVAAYDYDLAHMETAAYIVESLNLGFHLGSAVQRIAAAATQGSEGVPALREAEWLIERYIAILEKRPIGADLHLAAARLARSGDAIAGLKALADALDADVRADGEEPTEAEAEAEAEPEPEPEPGPEPSVMTVAESSSSGSSEHDLWGTGRIRQLSHDPPPA
jgi:hypothetical protein